MRRLDWQLVLMGLVYLAMAVGLGIMAFRGG